MRNNFRDLGGCLCAMLVILAVCAHPVLAVTRYGDVAIQVVTTSSGESNFGYVDYRATISNSGDTPHTIQLILPQQTYGYGQYIQQMTRTVTVPSGSASTVSLFQPPMPMYGSNVGVFIDGRFQRETMSLTSVNHCNGYYPNNQQCCVLVSQQIGFDDVHNGAEEVFKSEQTSRYAPAQNSLSLALAELPVSNWSRNWLSYSRYNGVLLTGYEWKTMPPEVKTALLEYVRCGGSLCVVGDTAWDATVSSFGNTTRGVFERYYPGFGVLQMTDQADISQWKNEDWVILKDMWINSARSLQLHKSIKEANDWFPVIDDLSIPVRGLLLIILIFAILMGPANLFILARKKRQIWLLWTVPLLSLTASVIVFGYATLAEGWKGYSRTMSLTILDENENLASTVGITAFYCPLTPREGLHFDYETECTAQMERYHGDSSRGRTIDWTEDQHLEYGWIASRIPAHFKLRKSQMRREKIIFSPPDTQSCQALNGFGVAVESLYYADAQGNLYHAENIQPGTKVTLERLDRPPLNGVQNPRLARDIFQADWLSSVNGMIKEPAGYLRPNCYIAIVKEPLFIEKALKKPLSEVFESVIYGISQGVNNAG